MLTFPPPWGMLVPSLVGLGPRVAELWMETFVQTYIRCSPLYPPTRPISANRGIINGKSTFWPRGGGCPTNQTWHQGGMFLGSRSHIIINCTLCINCLTPHYYQIQFSTHGQLWPNTIFLVCRLPGPLHCLLPEAFRDSVITKKITEFAFC